MMMIIILEINKPFQSKPGKYESNIMKRYWWLWFAITFLKIPLQDYSKDRYVWENKNEWSDDDENNTSK